MARFDCWRNPIEADRDVFPRVVEIQSDLLHFIPERVAVPLARPGAFPGMTDRLNPAFVLGGETLRLHPFGLTVFLRGELREPAGHLRDRAFEIEAAIDMLLHGY